MFGRSILLLSCLVLLGSTSKIHEILKKVGKRYQHEVIRDWVMEGDFDMHARYLDWTQFSDQKVAEIKEERAKNVMDQLVAATSTGNMFYEQGIMYLTGILNPDMEAKICGGEERKMNSYQFEKYLRQASAQYSKNPVIKSKKLEIMKTDERDDLKFRIIIEHADKFDVPITLEYYVEMDLTMGRKVHDVLFTISHITQGGSCAEYGTVDHLVEEPDVDKLKAQPTAKRFLNLFAHPDYEMFGTKKLPNLLRSLHPDDTIINVCQEGVTEPVVYSLKQFKVWYKNFGFMWHPKKGDDDSMGIQVVDFKDDFIVARITQKLQIGRDENAKVHDWNFKFSAKKTPTRWFINHLEVLCTPTVDHKTESLRVIGEVVAENFGREVAQLPTPTQWYSSVSFVNKFTKNHGLVEFKYCDHDTTNNITLLELYLVGRTFNMKFLKYSINHDDVTSPAPDVGSFQLTTLSSFQLGNTDIIYENDWNFDVKWDQMDQFYYVEKMNIGCHRKVEKEKLEESGFVEIEAKK